MQTVWKYPLSTRMVTQLELPAGAQVLSAAMQNNLPHIWVLVEQDEDAKVTRHFMFVGTGHPIPEPVVAFIGTVLMQDARWVFHVFEVVPAPAPEDVDDEA